MTVQEKLREILEVEKIKMEIKPDIGWFTLGRILHHVRLRKYRVWVITGKVIPEAGQISPAIAHIGHMKIMF